jgi:hypothetical protein
VEPDALEAYKDARARRLEEARQGSFRTVAPQGRGLHLEDDSLAGALERIAARAKQMGLGLRQKAHVRMDSGDCSVATEMVRVAGARPSEV